MALEQGHDVMKLTRMNLPGRANVHLTPGRTMMRWLPGEALSARAIPLPTSQPPWRVGPQSL
ncbi:Uncharacterised protein [Serratia entomophila]|nr:Uncharacterised protein [Serratia entomophila]